MEEASEKPADWLVPFLQTCRVQEGGPGSPVGQRRQNSLGKEPRTQSQGLIANWGKSLSHPVPPSPHLGNVDGGKKSSISSPGSLCSSAEKREMRLSCQCGLFTKCQHYVMVGTAILAVLQNLPPLPTPTSPLTPASVFLQCQYFYKEKSSLCSLPVWTLWKMQEPPGRHNTLKQPRLKHTGLLECFLSLRRHQVAMDGWWRKGVLKSWEKSF